MYQAMGYSAGPENHLLQARGERKTLNPEGFLENYFFMDLTLYAFYKTNSWGDSPPEIKETEQLIFAEKENDKMAYFSIVQIHDDRISNLNKLKVLINSTIQYPCTYLSKYFKEKSFIKNPHFSVLLPYIKKLFPASKMVVVFRNPDNTIRSAKKITPNADYHLYNSYYRNACDEYKNGNSRIIFISYDNLVSDPEYSVHKIAEEAHFMNNTITQNIISSIHEHKKEIINNAEWPTETSELYHFMHQHCVNK
jgi:hypothetical protein